MSTKEPNCTLVKCFGRAPFVSLPWSFSGVYDHKQSSNALRQSHDFVCTTQQGWPEQTYSTDLQYTTCWPEDEKKRPNTLSGFHSPDSPVPYISTIARNLRIWDMIMRLIATWQYVLGVCKRTLCKSRSMCHAILEPSPTRKNPKACPKMMPHQPCCFVVTRLRWLAFVRATGLSQMAVLPHTNSQTSKLLELCEPST